MGSPLTRNGEADQGQPGPQTARRTALALWCMCASWYTGALLVLPTVN